MSLGPWQLIIIALVILVLFGRGRISEMMGDFGKGVSSFKKGLNDTEETHKGVESARIEGPQHDAKPAGETVESKPADKTTSN